MASAAPSNSLKDEIAANVRLAGPLAIANVLQMLVHAIDVMFVAQLGQDALAAATLGISYYWLVNYGLVGVVSAVSPFVAAELGRRDNAVREVRRSIRMALWLAVAGGTLGMGLAMLGGPFYQLTGQDPQIAPQAAAFLALISLSMIPTQLTTALRIFVSVMGRPIFATFITGLAIVVNALANYALVFGNLGAPELGLLGSALASVATSIVTLFAYVVAIATNRRMRRFHLFGRWWRPEWQRLREMLRIGTPIGLTLMAEAGLFAGAAFLMGRIGAAELAAHSIALQICSFTFQVAYGVSQAATIRVGYFYGARDHQGIARAGRAALIMALTFMSVSAVALFAFPAPFLAIYIDSANPANAHLMAIGTQYLYVAAAFQIFDGTQAVSAGLLRGLQDTQVPMVIAIGGYWLIGFAAAVGLGFGSPLGGLGVWVGLAAGLVVVASALLFRWTRRARYSLLPALARA
ncbi:MAG: MATE family efflux transporter [Novosphingobium sp.]|nr:MATE family efflux transporter [Novosphingobium sp.]